MTVAEIDVFGLTLAELVVVVGFAGYVISVLRDWRPMKSLRQENRDLRALLEQAKTNFEDYKRESERQIATLTDDLARLKRATDLSPLRADNKETVKVLQALVAEVTSLDGSLKANTAAVETLSKRRIIDEALDEGGMTA